ncbi:MAG: ferredoxin [Chloroflexi bacterium]|nr:ferredoxin [Chloroflexota bacterium]
MDRELRVDWIACEAFGMCHDLAPDLVALDDWGYPILPSPSEVAARAGDVQRIIDCCPARALSLVRRDGRTQGRRQQRSIGAVPHQGPRLRA